MKFIAVTGVANSGKTAVVEAMIKALKSCGYVAASASIDTPVYRYISELFGYMPGEESFLERMNMRMIDFVARENQHMRFNYGSTILGTMLLNRVTHKGMNSYDYVIVDDASNALDLKVLDIIALIEVRRPPLAIVTPFVVPNADYCINNNQTLTRLKAQAQSAAMKIAEGSNGK